MNLFKRFLIIFLLGLSFSLSAYDLVGHRIVAEIAYQNLSATARLQLDKLLGKHGIVYAASWADEIRSDSNYKYSYQWHYQNLSDSMATADFEKLFNNPSSEGEHLFYALEKMETRLRKDKSDLEALKFLIHFVGDLHQPMHMGRLADLGGNKLEYNWFGKKTNLHSLWDGSLIENNKMSYTEYSAYLQDKYEPKNAAYRRYSFLASVEASYALRTEIYAYDYSNTNNFHYVYRFHNQLDDMLYRGGIQLANVLNKLYK